MPDFSDYMREIQNGRIEGMQGVREPESDMRTAYQQQLDQERRRMQALMEQDIFSQWDTGASPSGSERRRPADAKEPAAVAVAVSESLDAEFTEQYRSLAADLGLNAQALDSERFKGFISERGLTVYSRPQVDEYLHHKYALPKSNVTSLVQWGWRPLRAVDQVKGHADAKNGVVQRGATPYSKPIPYPVLLTVKDIRDSFPSARFYVSDEMHAERIPDPFLLVEIGGESFVVERWDEPAFRTK